MQNTITAEVMDVAGLARLLDGNKACRFVSLTYKAKESGEVAIHTLLLNVNRSRCLRVDVANLTSKLPTLDGVESVACQELIDSMTETLTTGRNSQYTKAGYYAKEGNGNVQVAETGVVYIRGYSVKKTVLVPGVYKEVKSSAKTIAKNKFRKELKNTKIREFIVTPANFKCARHDGKTIRIDASGSNLDKLAGLPPVTLAVPVPVSA
jgi:hypothetical protein